MVPDRDRENQDVKEEEGALKTNNEPANMGK